MRLARLLAFLAALAAALLAGLAAPAAAETRPEIAVEGRGAPTGAVEAALGPARAAVEDRLGPVDLAGVRVVVTTAAATARAGGVPDWAAAYAVPARGLVVVRIDRVGSYPHGSLAQVLAHELAHIALGRRLARGGELPRWFEEGLAMSIARETGPADAWQLSRDLLLGPELDLESLDARFEGGHADAQAAYALARAFVGWLEEEEGPGAARRVVEAAAQGRPFAEALRDATGRDLASLEAGWRREVVFYYRWVPIVTSTVTLWIGITLLVLVAWARKRRRGRKLRARWAMEDGELSEEDTSGPYGPH